MKICSLCFARQLQVCNSAPRVQSPKAPTVETRLPAFSKGLPLPSREGAHGRNRAGLFYEQFPPSWHLALTCNSSTWEADFGEQCKFEASLSYTEKSCLKKTK